MFPLSLLCGYSGGCYYGSWSDIVHVNTHDMNVVFAHSLITLN